MNYFNRKNFLLTISMLVSSPAWAASLYVSATGSDASNSCTSSSSPCATLQNAISQSSSGDTIYMAPGTYTGGGLISVSKTLTIRGANYGIDARTRSGGPETYIDNTKGITVKASDCVIDGLTIRGSNDFTGQSFGFGLLIDKTVDGITVVNNIFETNVSGLGLANKGNETALIQHNVFRNNGITKATNNGSGIYTDQYFGPAKNVVIDANQFISLPNVGIGFLSGGQVSDITITNNYFSNVGRGISLIDVKNATIKNNYMQNFMEPDDANFNGPSAGINLMSSSNVYILRNSMVNGVGYGIYISPPSTTLTANLQIHNNDITGFPSGAGMRVDRRPSDPVDFATCNWWGSPNGPKNPDNPEGNGEIVTGDVSLESYSPWSLAPGPDSACGKDPEPTPTPTPEPSPTPNPTPTPGPGPTPPEGFPGTWENSEHKTCLRIEDDSNEVLSFSKCGPFKCKKKEGVFSAYADGGVSKRRKIRSENPGILNDVVAFIKRIGDSQKMYGLIEYENPIDKIQELELVDNDTMKVRDFNSFGDDSPANFYRPMLYKKVQRCHWHPKWPFPPKPKPTPTPKPTPKPAPK